MLLLSLGGLSLARLDDDKLSDALVQLPPRITRDSPALSFGAVKPFSPHFHAFPFCAIVPYALNPPALVMSAGPGGLVFTPSR